MCGGIALAVAAEDNDAAADNNDAANDAADDAADSDVDENNNDAANAAADDAADNDDFSSEMSLPASFSFMMRERDLSLVGAKPRLIMARIVWPRFTDLGGILARIAAASGMV